MFCLNIQNEVFENMGLPPRAAALKHDTTFYTPLFCVLLYTHPRSTYPLRCVCSSHHGTPKFEAIDAQSPNFIKLQVVISP